MEEILKLFEKEGRLAKWAAEVRTYDISYIPRKEAEGPIMKKFFDQGEQVERTPDANEGGTLTLSKKLQAKSTPTPRAWRLYLGKEIIEEGSGVGIILALLARLAASTNQGMKELHVFIDSLTLVAQVSKYTPPKISEPKSRSINRIDNYKTGIPQPESIVLSRPTSYSISEDPEDDQIEEEPLEEPKEEGWEFDPEEDLEEDNDEDPEEDPADYPADRGDDGDDEDEPSDDDEDEEVDIEADDEEEEEHPAHADSTAVALPTIDQATSAAETEPFETDESAATPPPHPAYCVTARISIPAPVPTLVWSNAEVARLLAISTPLSLPLSSWSSPLPQIPFPPLPLIPSPSLPLSPPLPVSAPPPTSPIRLLGYRAAMIWLRAEAASTSHSLPLPPLSPILAPTSSPPLLLTFTNRREDRPEVTLPPQKRLGIILGPRYEVGESSSAAAARPAGGLREMINQGITAALAARDANRSTNGDDSHNSGTGVRRTERAAREFENQVKFATCTLYSVALPWWTLMSRQLVMMPLMVCLGKHS
ncbi:hypothetical protein Tco_0000904 [Tanacetum coccineum]